MMAEQTHFGAFVDHIMSDDDSDLGKMRAERDYALHCLEREIAICAQTQARNEALVKALEDVVRDVNEYERANNLAPNPGRTDCWDSVARAKAALASIKVMP